MWINLKDLNLDNFDMPFREEIRLNAKRLSSFDFKWEDKTEIGDYNAYTIAKRVLSHHVGKSIDDAYSKFCKLVKWHLRDRFFYYLNYNIFYVDDNGLIRKHKRKSYKKKLNSSEIRTVAERLKAHKKELRDLKKRQENIQYSFKPKQEVEDDRTCKVKLESHGFDKHSFRNH